MNKTKLLKLILVPVFIGLFLGYLFLHPASVFIFYIFEQNAFDLIQIIQESFSIFHIAMGMYFSVIGAVLGSIVAVYLINMTNTNSKLFDINQQLNMQNRRLQQKVLNTKMNKKFILKKIRPALNKIENGVDIVTNESAGGLNMRQSALLSITKDNIEQLNEIIGSLVLKDYKKHEERNKVS